MKSYGNTCIKQSLIVCNGLLMIFGIVLIATARKDIGLMHGFADIQTGHETDTALIAVGVMMIVVAAFGCFGVWKERPKLLYIFAGLLIIIILLALAVGIAAVVLRPQVEASLKHNLRVSFIKNKSLREEDDYYRAIWDRIQSDLQCCGVTGPENYRADDYNQASINPTYSCCPPDNSDKHAEIKRSDCLTNNIYYKEGCEDKVLSTIHNVGMSVIVCGILFCFLEITGVVLALKLAHVIKTQGKC